MEEGTRVGNVLRDTSGTGWQDARACLQEARARKFSALASLFTLDVDAYPSAIASLLDRCPGVGDCPVVSGPVRQAGAVALAWATDEADLGSIGVEHVRLFGGADKAREMPLVSPCAASYMLTEYDGDPAVLSAVYNAAGFTPVTGAGVCPAHISNELGFAAHCLGRGNHETASIGRAFVATHLADWGVVFAAATCARSAHPVTRFAGMMLEHMLFCEMDSARSDEALPAGLLGERTSQQDAS